MLEVTKEGFKGANMKDNHIILVKILHFVHAMWILTTIIIIIIIQRIIITTMVVVIMTVMESMVIILTTTYYYINYLFEELNFLQMFTAG